MSKSNLYQVNVRCEFQAGTSINEAIREAAILSLTGQRVVTFEFNGIEVVVDYKKIIDAISLAWQVDRSAA